MPWITGKSRKVSLVEEEEWIEGEDGHTDR